MCQFDVSQYLYPCHTFVYRLIHRCRQIVPRCRKITLRQRHIRKEGPCKHPQVCDWCQSADGLGKDAVMKFWNEAKSALLTLPMEVPALPELEPTPDATFVEYDGTTYYVSPSEFQHRILPKILQKRNARRVVQDNKAAKQNGTSSPVIVVTPDWRESPERPVAIVGPEPIFYTVDEPAQVNNPLILKPTITDRGKINAKTSDENRSETYYSILSSGPPSQNDFLPLRKQSICEWKLQEEIDPKGRFMVAVNYRWSIQQLSERVSYQSWPSFIHPESFTFGRYCYPIYQQIGYYL